VRALEEAGYATDPRYAEKIERILATDVLSAAGEGVKNPADRSTT
jgi:flagellum-specific peptidoglycan hydrolase FlgJ